MKNRVDQSPEPRRKRGARAGLARGEFDWVLDIETAAAAADAAAQPLFLRIARAMSAEIRRGRLKPDARLPGSRELARTLSVHRNTVLAAYRELIAEGWIEPRHGQGTFVSSQLPDVEPRSFRRARPRRGASQPVARSSIELPSSPLEPIGGRTYPKHVLRMFGGLPDLREAPNEALARALRRALRRDSNLLDYSHPSGHPRLRAAIASMLRATRGLAISAEDVCLTRGSQMAIALAADTLLRPGDTVAIEALGYRTGWQALLRTGAKLEPIPIDRHGLSVPRLAALCEKQPVRAVYVTPHHHYPTTVPLAPGRRLELLELARRHHFAVIEDDYDHEFHYEGRPLSPLASADDAGSVVYAGTLSKVFAPGLRIGYLVAPEPVLREIVRRRYYLDRQGDHVMEAAVAELIEDGELQRHTRRMRRLYHARRDACAQLLRQHLGAALQFDVPNGGMALWARAAPEIDVDLWLERAEAAGVVFQTEKYFRWDRRAGSGVRLGYAPLTEAELTLAVRRLRESLPARGRRAG